eukprot:1177567-Prorocentrum_minimum.AAC.4
MVGLVDTIFQLIPVKHILLDTSPNGGCTPSIDLTTWAASGGAGVLVDISPKSIESIESIESMDRRLCDTIGRCRAAWYECSSKLITRTCTRRCAARGEVSGLLSASLPLLAQEDP